ncbi:Cysteine synthase 2 [Sorochytrium milnesiophthora]
MHSHPRIGVAAVVGAAAGSLLTLLTIYWTRQRWRPATTASTQQGYNTTIYRDVTELIGNTPLIRLQSLSDATGCEILAKAEFLNPGGSSKDRVALGIIQMAEQQGLIAPHSDCTIFEGTVGSTGISLAMICKARGYKCHIVMPDDVAREKVDMLTRLGATVELVRPASIVDKKQFVNLARTCADLYTQQHESSKTTGRGFFADQFENLANFRVHYTTTSPELFEQTQGQLDAFVMGAGTGGTLAGVARYLKPRVPGLQVILADPAGSGLYNKVKHNIFYSHQEAEGTRRRHQVDTIVEGVGINRLTRNFSMAMPGEQQHYHEGDTDDETLGYGLTIPGSGGADQAAVPQVTKWIDDAVRVSDREAVEMSRYLMHEEGLFVGSSSCVNLVAAVRVAKALGPGKRIVTLLCDSGSRHLTKFWNDAYLEKVGLTPTAQGLEFIY